jgi:hypothetical protein
MLSQTLFTREELLLAAEMAEKYPLETQPGWGVDKNGHSVRWDLLHEAVYICPVAPIARSRKLGPLEAFELYVSFVEMYDKEFEGALYPYDLRHNPKEVAKRLRLLANRI